MGGEGSQRRTEHVGYRTERESTHPEPRLAGLEVLSIRGGRGADGGRERHLVDTSRSSGEHRQWMTALARGRRRGGDIMDDLQCRQSHLDVST